MGDATTSASEPVRCSTPNCPIHGGSTSAPRTVATTQTNACSSAPEAPAREASDQHPVSPEAKSPAASREGDDGLPSWQERLAALVAWCDEAGIVVTEVRDPEVAGDSHPFRPADLRAALAAAQGEGGLAGHLDSLAGDTAARTHTAPAADRDWLLGVVRGLRVAANVARGERDQVFIERSEPAAPPAVQGGGGERTDFARWRNEPCPTCGRPNGAHLHPCPFAAAAPGGGLDRDELLVTVARALHHGSGHEQCPYIPWEKCPKAQAAAAQTRDVLAALAPLLTGGGRDG